jgi:hypothetical protein
MRFVRPGATKTLAPPRKSMFPKNTAPVVPARFLRPLLPALAVLGLAFIACSSSDDPAPAPDKGGEQGDDGPKGGSENAGGVGGTPTDEPSDAGSPPVAVGGAAGAPMGMAGTPAVDPGAGGSGGEEPGSMEPSEAFLRGEALVELNACAVCHQVDMGGFTVFPNISPDELTGIGSWTDDEISAAIREGVDKDGAAMCATMQRFPFDDAQVADVIAFLRGVPAVKRSITSDCP